MDCVCPPSRALLRARRATDDESQGEAHRTISNYYPENRQCFDLRQHWIVLRSFLFQDDPSLPISNEPLDGTITWDTASPRRRFRSSQTNPTRTPVSNSLHNNDVASLVDEQTEQGEGGEEEDKATSCIPTLPNSKMQGKRHNIRETRHNNRIEALKKELEPMCTENGSAVVLLCWGENSCCSILPVPVSYPEDEVATWSEINKAWYTRRGYWRKHLPGFGVTWVDIVEVCYVMLLLGEALLTNTSRSQF